MSKVFHVNPANPTPIYAQLTRAIQFAIATGDLRIVETRRGVGTFISDRPLPARLDNHRDDHLRDFIDRFIAEAGALGFSLDDLISQLKGRRKKESKTNV